MHTAVVTAVAVAGALALFRASWRPARWVWRRIVVLPITAWFRAEVERAVEVCIAPVYEQLKPNGGSSLRDRVDEIEKLIREREA